MALRRNWELQCTQTDVSDSSYLDYPLFSLFIRRSFKLWKNIFPRCGIYFHPSLLQNILWLVGEDRFIQVKLHCTILLSLKMLWDELDYEPYLMGIGQDVLPQSKHRTCLNNVLKWGSHALQRWSRRSLLLLRMKNQTVANKYCKLVEAEAADFFLNKVLPLHSNTAGTITSTP